MSTAGQNTTSLTAECGPRPLDREIAALAGRQHGVVTRAQLRSIGLGDSSISQRVAAGRLHRVHTGVYSVAPTTLLTQHGRWLAAILACGPDAVLSHHSAAAFWRLRPGAPASIDVTVPRTGRRSRGRLRIHRPRKLLPAETTTRRDIPVTTPARTMLDLAALNSTRLDELLDRNATLGLTGNEALESIARAHPAHRGARRLQRALDRYDATATRTRSGLERLFLRLCAEHDLPRPRTNVTVAEHEVDFLFTPGRLIVEADSWTYHRSRTAFEHDRAKDAITTRAGYRTLRFTDDHLTHDPRAVAATIRAALQGEAATPPPARRSRRRSPPPPASDAAGGPRRAP